MKIIITIILIAIYFYSCNNKVSGDEEFDKIKLAIEDNYRINKNSFNNLNKYFHLQNIKHIKFNKNNKIFFEYLIPYDSTKWGELKNVDIFSNQTKKILSLIEKNFDTDSLINLLQLTKKLSIIDVRLSDFYSPTAKDKKTIDLKFEENFYDTPFFYKIFESKIDGHDSSFFIGKNGGILDKYVAWYPQ